ncbi:hypothetical protein PR202_ga12927 [Eleusine coracana subsp. coracana]|uniref:Secreted protein n=1 Tax=Eleusine coracana subsp. coracana TaxID=191504 RepID=A0AAV5CCQ1_ELECO|nr:hypothetical protein PR202_ga12927 [Eleusine coracana subsp. coracana]
MSYWGVVAPVAGGSGTWGGAMTGGGRVAWAWANLSQGVVTPLATAAPVVLQRGCLRWLRAGTTAPPFLFDCFWILVVFSRSGCSPAPYGALLV